MSADLYFTTDSFFFLSFFFFFTVWSPSSLNGTQPYPATWSEVSVIWKPMSSIWGISFPYKSGGPKTTFFGRRRNSTATLTAYILGMKHGIHKQASVLQTTRGLLHSLKTLWTLVHKGTNSFKLEVSFYPPSVNSAFHFIARLRRQRSANGTQPNFAK